MDRVGILASTPLFEGLDMVDLEPLARQLVERSFQAGETIIRQGEAADAMYIVAEGQVNIFLPGEDSRRISLKDIGRGEYLGELSLFDSKPRSASALATTPAILLELKQKTLGEYLRGRPQAAMAILRMMAGRVRETNALLSERAAKNVMEEMDRSLTWKDRLADRVAELNGSWSFILGLLLLIIGWSVINSLGAWFHPFDPYPYVFFNLVLGVLVALQGPLIIMSQNRQAHKDRRTADTDFRVNLKNEVNIETILRELGEFRAETNVRLESLEGKSAHRGTGPPSR